MKFKHLLTICMASAAIAASAQGYKDGIEYYRADQLSNAKTLLERNFNKPETDKAAANYYLGAIALRQGDAAKAKQYFDAGIAANPDFGLNYVGLGELQLRNKDLKAAESEFKLAEKNSGKEDAAAIRVAIARAYYNVDPVAYQAKIEKYIADARKKKLSEPDIYLLEGDMKAAKQDWNGAAADYDMAIYYKPETAEGYVKYANLYNQVNPDYQVAKLQELLGIMPQSALGQRELALAYYEKEEYGKAADQYGKYVKNPNHFKEDEDQYSLLLFFNSEYQKGYDYASQLLKENPSNFTAQRFQFMNAAQIPAMSDQMVGLADKLVSSRNDKNKFAPIDYNLLSAVYTQAGRLDDAKKMIAEAMQNYPKDPQFSKSLAEMLIEEENYPEAAKAYSKYVANTKSPKYSEYITESLYNYIAGVDQLSKGAQDVSEFFNAAIDAANNSIKMFPDQYRGYKMIGDVKIQQAGIDANLAASAAVDDYVTAMEKMAAMETPNANDAGKMVKYLANYYNKVGDKASADKYIQMYLKIDPADAAGVKALL